MALDRKRVVSELEPEWLDGLDGAELDEGRGLLGEIVAEWALEADSTPDPEAVLAVQRKTLDERRGDDPAARLEALRAQVTERKVERLNSETFALGKKILKGTVEDDDAREQGRAFLARAETLAAELAALGRSSDDPYRRELNEAVMEALYAVERQAMSARLSRDVPGGPSGGPSVRP